MGSRDRLSKEYGRVRFSVPPVWGAAFLLVLLFCISFSLGRYPVSLGDLFRVLLSLPLGGDGGVPPMVRSVVLRVRIPRVCAAVLIGGALSVSGAVYQGLFRNPMVSPDILGASAGACFGAGHCERCGTPVIKKNLNQWYFRTTQYADQLLDFSGMDWPERVRTLQTNWIGRSEGASVTFETESGDPLVVFTTRPDTLWGATFMVLAPEHPLVGKLTTQAQKAAIGAYIEEAARQTDIQREAEGREKTGVFTGSYAINPVNGKRIPIWIADYVLMG